MLSSHANFDQVKSRKLSVWSWRKWSKGKIFTISWTWNWTRQEYNVNVYISFEYHQGQGDTFLNLGHQEAKRKCRLKKLVIVLKKCASTRHTALLRFNLIAQPTIKRQSRNIYQCWCSGGDAATTYAVHMELALCWWNDITDLVSGMTSQSNSNVLALQIFPSHKVLLWQENTAL